MFRASVFAVLASILILHAKAIAQPAEANSEEIKPGDTIILVDAAELRGGEGRRRTAEGGGVPGD